MRRAARAAAWATLGYLAAVLMAFAGSKLHGLFVRTWSIPDLLARGVSWVARRIEQWRTWQGASPDQRWRWLRVRPLEHPDGDDRHDVFDLDPHEPVVLKRAVTAPRPEGQLNDDRIDQPNNDLGSNQ